MEIPKTINILGVEFKVKLVAKVQNENIIAEEDKKLELAGYCSCNHNMILISTETEKQNQFSVFMHEVLEAIDGMLALHLAHDNIDRLEAALYQVLTQNKLLKE